MTNTDAYTVLAEKHGYAHSARYLRILEFFMTPQQARIVADLPSPLEEIAQRQDLLDVHGRPKGHFVLP